MSQAPLERLFFVVSLAILALLYGYGAKSFGWFPGKHLDRAVLQASHLLNEPPYLYPRVHQRSGIRSPVPFDMQPGLTLVSTRWSELGWDPGLKLLDEDGNVLHQWHVDPGWFADREGILPPSEIRRQVEERPVHGVHLFPNGDIIFNLDYVGTVRVDACSRVLWLAAVGSHHTIAPAGEESFWIPGSSAVEQSTTPAHPEGLPGLEMPMYMDRVLRLSSEGEVLESRNVLDLLYANGLQRHIFKSKMTGTTDVTHLNDIEPLPSSLAEEFPEFDAGDLLLSLRNIDLVMVVDPESWTVKWHASHPFIAQHDPDFLEGGWIGVFDNNRDGTFRGTALDGSRIVALQPHTDSTRILFPTAHSDTFYTDIMGKWQRLENGNILLTEARAGRVIEVDTAGRTIWEWIVEPYDESRVPEVTEGARYDLTEEEVADWPCSPKEAD